MNTPEATVGKNELPEMEERSALERNQTQKETHALLGSARW